ncbi:elongation factor P [bacterium]|nr:elongation factor P [bacterium]
MVAVPVQKVSNGMKLEFRDDVWTIVEFHHVKPGKGGSFVRIKIKSLTTGRVLEETFQGSERVEQTEVAYRKMSYLYDDGSHYVFMDSETFEQLPIEKDQVGDQARFLVENMEVVVLLWEDKIIGVELPAKVDLKVIDTMSVDRGNTATNVTKAAKLESGGEVQVPPFVNVGDVVRIDTRDGSYESRV